MTCLQPEDRRENAEFPQVVCWLPAISQWQKIKGSTRITTLTLFISNKIQIFTWGEIVWHSEAAQLQWQETNENLAKGECDCHEVTPSRLSSWVHSTDKLEAYNFNWSFFVCTVLCEINWKIRIYEKVFFQVYQLWYILMGCFFLMVCTFNWKILH